MKEIISVINQKGGVAKTTTAQALAAGLRLAGNKVLAIDMDSQASLTYAMGADKTAVSILDVLLGNAKIAEAIQHTEEGDIIGAGPDMAGADLKLNELGKENRLREGIERLESEYDYLVIDTPPSLGIMTVNALTASTLVIIPAFADEFSMQGISELYKTIYAIRRYTNPKIEVRGILRTKFNPRTVISRDMSDNIIEAASGLGTKVFDSYIRECIALQEAQASQRNIFDYAPDSNAALDYMNFINEAMGVRVK